MRRLLLSMTVCLASCASGVESPSAEDVAFHQAEATATAEVNRHWVELTHATEIDAVRAEMARHEAAMTPVLTELTRLLAPCGATMDEVSEIEDAHTTELARMTDVGAARVAADVYARTAGDALHALVERWESCR